MRFPGKIQRTIKECDSVKRRLVIIVWMISLPPLILGQTANKKESSRSTVRAIHAADTWVDKSPHQVGFVVVNGIRLHYLDWGGKGEALLFLTGMGDSAHIFDDLAPKFTDSFRVLGLTRRGQGKSDKPESGYDTGTLVEDIRQFLDLMKIRRVILVGHSLAGNELTRFAEAYPDRVKKLVYLDAAYDRAGLPEKYKQAPSPPAASKEDRASFERVHQWVMKNWSKPWTDAWEADLRDIIIFDPQEGVYRSATPDAVYAAMLKGSEESHPDYAKVKAPALSFYALYDVAAMCAVFTDEASRQKMKDFIELVLIPHQRENIAGFKREMVRGRVIEMPNTDHACFIQKQDEVVREIRAFLLGKSGK
jgi:non-heme chloroperoxidase